MKNTMRVLMLCALLPINGCLSAGGGFGAEVGPAKIGGSANVGPGPLLGNVGIDLSKKK